MNRANENPSKPKPDDMTLGFARIVELGTRIGLVLVVAGFLVYLSGLLNPLIDPERLPGLIAGGVDEFVRANGVPTGWGLLPMLGYGDMLSLASLLLLVAVIVAAYFSLIPSLLRRRDYIYFVLVILQLAVFLVAGGGWLVSSGH